MYLYVYVYITVELLNKGHIGDNIQQKMYMFCIYMYIVHVQKVYRVYTCTGGQRIRTSIHVHVVCVHFGLHCVTVTIMPFLRGQRSHW